MDIFTRKVTRQDLSRVFPDHKTLVAFENAQTDIVNSGDLLSRAEFVLLAPDDDLGSERVLTASANVSIDDGGPGGAVTLDLTDTGVTAGNYGSATRLAGVTVDEFGRISFASDFEINTSNIVEGSKLFFTNFRALSAFVPSIRISINTGTGAIDTIGFSGGPSAYTNFTFVNGICTAAS